MKYLLFFITTVLATFLAEVIRLTIKGGVNDKVASRYILLALSSLVCCLGFSAVMVCDEPRFAYIFRTVGMAGVFGFMISAVNLIVLWVDLPKKWRYYVVGFAFLGLLLFPFIIQPNVTIFINTHLGMSYSVKNNMWTNLYVLYCLCVIVIVYAILIWALLNVKSKRKKLSCKYFILGVSCIGICMIVDTVLPMLGVPVFPIKNLGQAICVIIVYNVMAYDRKNQLNMASIAKYVDKSSELYVMAYDESLRVRFASNSASANMELEEDKIYRITDLFSLEPSEFLINEKSKKIDSVCIRNGKKYSLGIERILDEFGDIVGYVVSATDMTEKYNYICQIEEAKKQADMANEAKSAFLANMSHEIRTPLSAVLGMDEMILRENNLDEIYRLAGSIQSAGKSLLAIIEDVLDFSKIESGNMSIVDVSYRTDQAIRLVYSIVNYKAQKKGIELKVKVDEKIPRELMGDELRIRQIMLNIINNAIKYTKVGWVKVDISYRNTGKNTIELIFRVEDTGIGIKREDIPNLFEKFRRFDKKSNHNIEGSGLGLSIAHNLAKMMGGNIDAKSVYHRGSIFTVTIPQRVVNEVAVGVIDFGYCEVESNEAQAFVAPEAKILAVDDNLINLTIVKGLLRRTKMRVDTVSSGYECLKKVKSESYDIILLDHMMPGIDGVEVLRKLRMMDDNKSEGAAVIALTANAITGAREEYMAYGFNDYISKPIDSKELEDTIKRYLPTQLVNY